MQKYKEGALSDLRVIEMGQLLAGPFCGQLLGDFGAEGTAIKNLNGINSSNFLDAFSNKGRFQSYLKKIPLVVLKDPEATLFSSACRAHLIAESNGRLS